MTTVSHDKHAGHEHGHQGHGHADHGAGHHEAPTQFFRKYVFSTDHKVIGMQFMFASLVFVIVGGGLALAVRYQLAWPNQNVPFAAILPGQMTDKAPEANVALWHTGGSVVLNKELELGGVKVPAGATAEVTGFPKGLAVTILAGTRIEDSSGSPSTLATPLAGFVSESDVIGDYDYAKKQARANANTVVHNTASGDVKVMGVDQPAPGPNGTTVIRSLDGPILLPLHAELTPVTLSVKAQQIQKDNDAAVVQVVAASGQTTADAVSFGKLTLKSDAYLTLFTMHATLMVFFVLMPMLMGGFGNFLIPLMIGARDMAFPKLNLLSFWLSVPAAIIMFASFWTSGGAAGGGWTMYATLSGKAYSPNLGTTLWLLSIFIVGFSTIVGTLNYLTTIINMRAPGMTMFRMPLTVWSLFITSVLALLATPVLAAAAILLFLDRTIGTHFFTPESGGQPLMWQHLFWFFGHPEVYILILPPMGITSDVIATFARKPIFGYKPMVFAMSAIAFLGFIVWGHHMFQSGMNPVLGTTFMASTIMIAVPSAIKTFNWLGTLWGGNIRFTTAAMFAIGFVAMFVVGGLSGIFMAAAPVDIQIHDTYFIVAHIHYVFFGGTMFGVFAGLYYWYPKMFGRQMNERWGRIHFIMTIIAFNWTFFAMHILGVGGHPRRYASIMEVPTLQHLQPLNVFMTVGALMLGAAQLPFFYNFFVSLPRGLGRAISAVFIIMLAGPAVIGLSYWSHATEGFSGGVTGLAYAAVLISVLAVGIKMLIDLPLGGRIPVALGLIAVLAFILWPFYGGGDLSDKQSWAWFWRTVVTCVGFGAIFSVAVVAVVWVVWAVGGALRLPALLQRLLYVVFLPAYLAPLLMKHDPYMWINHPSLYDHRWVLLILTAVPGLAYLLVRKPKDEFGFAPGDNPWQANSLEWATSSPPPFVNFHEIPTVYRGPYEFSSPAVEEDYLPQPRVLPPGVIEPTGH